MAKVSNADAFSIMGCCKRRYKVSKLAPTADVVEVFGKYAQDDLISAEKFKDFLKEEQGEKEVSEEHVKMIFDKYVSHEKTLLSRPKNGLTLATFFQYLLDGELNMAHDNKVYQDMTLPTSQYFIYTGHNSYLTGNQLNSDCSEQPIIKALKRGVRVIELDLWPNKKNDAINVLHGGTLTSPVSFETCITAIRDHAFEASPFPVVITFEDHLTPELQAKAAEITTRVLGKLLYIPGELQQFKEFPSPESLKRKILISTKPPKEYLQGAAPSETMVQKVTERVESAKGKRQVKKGPVRKAFEWGEDVPDFDASEERAKLDPSDVPVEKGESDDDDKVEPYEADHITNPEYKRIISIRAGKPKGKSLVGALAVDENEHVRRVSLSEPQLEKVAKNHPTQVIKFTQCNLLRIYPYGLRFDSSNYNPLIAWSHGAQMVAFNMQGYGRKLWLVHGFFRANGGCGYVLKPKFLLSSEGHTFNPREIIPPKITLKVKVVMGLGWLEKFGKTYFDYFSPPDFYTRVGIAGVPADSIMKRTKTIQDQWIPKWEEIFEFPVSVPELAVLRVEVHEYDMADGDDFAGQTCLPVTEIKPGFRTIPLLDKKGFPLDGVKLLFHFSLSH